MEGIDEREECECGECEECAERRRQISPQQARNILAAQVAACERMAILFGLTEEECQESSD